LEERREDPDHAIVFADLNTELPRLPLGFQRACSGNAG
jgi:hypothetical protein